MKQVGGYSGSILKVDLSTGNIRKIPLSEELYTKFLGGAGINARLAYDCIEPHAGALAPQNALILGVGPLVGTLVPGAAKSNITAKSPASGLFGSSGSGHLGLLKFAGYDHVVITGRAAKPVYLKIGDGVEIREADHIWGRDTWETTEAVWRELGRQYAVLAIGPAGENLVRDASIIANKYSAYARTGMGAVMGSKNLKAIAVYGSQAVEVTHPKRFVKLVDRLSRDVANLLDQRFHKYGKGLVHLEPLAKAGGLSYQNFRQIVGADFLKSFDIDQLLDQIERRKRSCFSCPIGCKHYMFGKEGGELAGLALPISCGLNPVLTAVNCGVSGWREALEFAELCNRLGMDQISISGLIAMAVELYEKGIITKEDTGGTILDWDSGTLHGLTQAIAYRRDIGDVLANGFIEASQQIGHGAEDYAIHSKGIGSLEPRLFFSPFVLGSITNATGHFPNTMYFKKTGDELQRFCQRIGMTEKDRLRILTGPDDYNLARMTKWVDDYSLVLECLGLCMAYTYQEFDLQVWADLYTAVTGIEMDVAGLLACAARSWDMKRAFNVREGAGRKDDAVPRRFLAEAVSWGEKLCPPLDSTHIDGLITDYYRERGWDQKEGAVNPARVAELTKTG